MHICIVIMYNHQAEQVHRGFSAVGSFAQGVLFLITAGLYLFGKKQYLNFLVLCLALSWVNMLYFSRGDKHMGVYSVMIQKVVHTGHTAPRGTRHGTIPEDLWLFFGLCR